MQFVYRYLENDMPVYIGITNSMDARICQHKTDKLSAIKNPKIEYCIVEHRADAELLETYLINYFGTGKKFNVAKAHKGPVSFLGDVPLHIKWTPYVPGRIDGEYVKLNSNDYNAVDIARVAPVVVEKKVKVPVVLTKRGELSLDQIIQIADREIEQEIIAVEGFIRECDDFIKEMKRLIRNVRAGNGVSYARFSSIIKIMLLAKEEKDLLLKHQHVAIVGINGRELTRNEWHNLAEEFGRRKKAHLKRYEEEIKRNRKTGKYYGVVNLDGTKKNP